ncbi:extracellular solute-binding protein [Ruminococcaceae bacterium OttesenSCG-928-D13]|nr:extracellular solute-binding protein [Ruminococcaceae bacterium OttesenSCG-928-D13]
MKLRKWAALAMAVVLCAGLLAACGGTPEPASTPAGSEPASVPVTTGDDGREMVGNMYVEGFPIVKEPVTYKILVCNDGDPNTMPFYEKYAELTNVNIEWEFYDYDTTVEKKNLMYTTGEYFDGVGTWCLGDADILTYADDVWVALDGMIEQYAPNIKYAFDNFPNAWGTMTTPNGHVYGLPIMAKQPDCGWIMHINQKWLDNLDLEMPETLEDFENVLRAFKEQDANGNGDAGDEIPFSFYDTGANNIYGNMFGAWGVLAGQSNQLMLRDGEVLFAPAEEGYKEGVKWLNKLYAEGLIDPEAFTQDSINYQTRGQSGDDSVYGVFIDFTGVNVVGEQRYVDEYISLAPLAGPDGTRMWGQGDPSIFRNMFAISTAAENPEILLRWLDGLFDPEMSYQVTNGELGEWTEKGDDGVYRYKPFPEGMTESEVRNKYCVSAMPYCIMPDFPMEQNSNQVIKTEADKRVSPYITDEPFPSVWRTPEQNERLSVISADLLKLAADKRVAWITGQANIDAEWDNYLADLGKIGLEDYASIYQEAVDAYFANIS